MNELEAFSTYLKNIIDYPVGGKINGALFII